MQGLYFKKGRSLFEEDIVRIKDLGVRNIGNKKGRI